MEKLKTEFIETLRRLVAREKNLATNFLYTWDVYGFHFDEHGTICPVCGNPESRWLVTYQHQRTMQQCSVCHKCANKIVRNNAGELLKCYVILKEDLNVHITKTVLDYCLKAGVIDTKGYKAYLNISAFHRTIRLTRQQFRLIRAINYQFVKLVRERMPNKDKSTFSNEFMFVTH